MLLLLFNVSVISSSEGCHPTSDFKQVRFTYEGVEDCMVPGPSESSRPAPPCSARSVGLAPFAYLSFHNARAAPASGTKPSSSPRPVLSPCLGGSLVGNRTMSRFSYDEEIKEWVPARNNGTNGVTDRLTE